MNIKKSPLKTLFILPSLDAGGAEKVLISLANNINQKKYEPSLLSIRRHGPLKDTINPNVSFYTRDKKPTRLIFPFLYSLFKKIKRISPDIVISTMPLTNFAVLMLKPLFPNTIFIVREAITPSFLLQKYKKTNFLIKKLYCYLYPKADLVLSPAEVIFNELKNELSIDDSNFQLLKNPVNVSKIRESIIFPKDLDPQKDKIRFVACGRLGKQKGFDRLIIALERFNPQSDWKLDILGEGEEHDYLEELIKSKNLEDKVFLKGLIMPPYFYMAQADCLLMPSRFEGLPNAALESLACGTVVIATKESGGIREIAEDCSKESVCIVEDMDHFVKEMEKISPQAKNKASQSLLAECYDQEVVFKQFENTLDDIFHKRFG